ncbi:hypothetical protein BX666DRAFT_1863009, partial [Dichotomocladium elegans]
RSSVPPVTGCLTHGQVALTFNEGPSDVTARIVRQLNHAQVRASFFINATRLYEQRYAMVVQNMYNAGHLIGMAYRAPISAEETNSPVSDDSILRQDIIKNAQMIERLVQVAPKYVRLPYSTTADTRTEQLLRDLGFILVSYNLDSLDYTHTSGEQVQEVFRSTFRRQKDTYDAKGSFISIQSDIPGSASVNGTAGVIKAIDEEGYVAVRMDGCLNDPNPYKQSKSSLEYVHDRFSFNTSGYHQGQSPFPILQSADEDERGLSVEDRQEDLLENEFSAALRVASTAWVALMAMAFSVYVLI